MKTTLKSYVAHYPNFIKKSLCKDAVNELKMKEGWNKHTFYNPTTGTTLSYEDEPDMYMRGDITQHNTLMDLTWQAIHKYISELEFDWYPSWNGFSSLKYINYNVKTKMRNHCDHAHDIFDGQRKGIPVLTVIGLLHDRYKGGELILFDDYEVKLKAGDVIIFPSNFLFPHRVNPLTYGTRYTFASFVW